MTLFSNIIFFCCSAFNSDCNICIPFENCLILFSIIACFSFVSLYWFLREFVDCSTVLTFSCWFCSFFRTFVTVFSRCLLLSDTCWIALLKILSTPFLSFVRSSSLTILSSFKASFLTGKLRISFSKALTSFKVSEILLSEFFRRSLVLCVVLLVVLRPSRTFFISFTNCSVLLCSFPILSFTCLFSSLKPSRVFFISLPNCLVLFCSFCIPSLTCSCFSVRPSRTFFISLPNCLVLFCSFTIPSLRKSNISILRLPTSFSSSKRLFTSLFKALSSFEISVFFLSEFLKRSLVLCIALLQTFMPVLIFFKSSWKFKSIGTVFFSFSSFNSHCRWLMFSCNSFMICIILTVFPCSSSSVTIMFW